MLVSGTTNLAPGQTPGQRQKNGKNFVQNLHEANPAGIYTNFVFEPTMAGQYSATSKLTVPDYLENRYVNIVHYRSDYIFEVVNK